MGCLLCHSEEVTSILDMPPAPIWTNSPDDLTTNYRFSCRLNLCRRCGHIYQPVNDNLNQALNAIYSSTQAQLSTSMTKGNWGKERGAAFMRVFLEMVDIKHHKSVFEIGCDDGYLLKILKDKGVKELAGIEPSLSQTIVKEGITLIKGFANTETKLDKTFSLIFSSSVFEHIEDMNSIMDFCKAHLKENGQLYFDVPNAEFYIKDTDPALFTHQHVHYFTDTSARQFMAAHGFEVVGITKDRDNLLVLSQRSNDLSKSPVALTGMDYQSRLIKNIEKLKSILHKPKTIVHGVNNALNNVLAWTGEHFDFTLVDNDTTKHGKVFFGKTVSALDKSDLKSYEQVIIAAHAFEDVIRKDYLMRGFTGDIIGITHVA